MCARPSSCPECSATKACIGSYRSKKRSHRLFRSVTFLQSRYDSVRKLVVHILGFPRLPSHITLLVEIAARVHLARPSSEIVVEEEEDEKDDDRLRLPLVRFDSHHGL